MLLLVDVVGWLFSFLIVVAVVAVVGHQFLVASCWLFLVVVDGVVIVFC